MNVEVGLDDESHDNSKSGSEALVKIVNGTTNLSVATVETLDKVVQVDSTIGGSNDAIFVKAYVHPSRTDVNAGGVNLGTVELRASPRCRPEFIKFLHKYLKHIASHTKYQIIVLQIFHRFVDLLQFV